MADARAFLSAAGWGAAVLTPLAGDASARSYLRATHPDGRRAILMQAPPAPDDSTARFVAIDRLLGGWGLSAPVILAEAARDGLLLLEDLGDGVFARVIEATPAQEVPLYAAAVDLLADLHRRPAPAGLPHHDPATLAAMTGPAAIWYVGQTRADAEPEAVVRDLKAILAPLLDRYGTPTAPVLVLRDFHAENLIWLPDRAGAAKVGLLDFQDAVAGHPAYDLASLLDDARRDVADEARTVATARYIAATGLPREAFATSLATLGAQRNLRILGVFARLCLHVGKARYVDMIPRVWTNLQANLAHPELADLADFVRLTFPAPTPDLLQGLKARCGTIPTP